MDLIAGGLLKPPAMGLRFAQYLDVPVNQGLPVKYFFSGLPYVL